MLKVQAAIQHQALTESEKSFSLHRGDEKSAVGSVVAFQPSLGNMKNQVLPTNSWNTLSAIG